MLLRSGSIRLETLGCGLLGLCLALSACRSARDRSASAAVADGPAKQQPSAPLASPAGAGSAHSPPAKPTASPPTSAPAKLPDGLLTPGCARLSNAVWCWGVEPTSGAPGPYLDPHGKSKAKVVLKARRTSVFDSATSVASGVFTYFVDDAGKLWVVGRAQDTNAPDSMMHEYDKPEPWLPGHRFERVSSSYGWDNRGHLCALSASELVCWSEGYVSGDWGPLYFDRLQPRVFSLQGAEPGGLGVQSGYAGVYYSVAGSLSFLGTQRYQPSVRDSSDRPQFTAAAPPLPLPQAGKVRELVTAVELNHGCVLREEGTVACFMPSVRGFEAAESFLTIPGLANVQRLTRGRAYYATLVNGERHVFDIRPQLKAGKRSLKLVAPRRMHQFEGGQLLGDRAQLGPDCHLTKGQVVCWFELDAQTLKPKHRFVVEGLPKMAR